MQPTVNSTVIFLHLEWTLSDREILSDICCNETLIRFGWSCCVFDRRKCWIMFFMLYDSDDCLNEIFEHFFHCEIIKFSFPCLLNRKNLSNQIIFSIDLSKIYKSSKYLYNNTPLSTFAIWHVTAVDGVKFHYPRLAISKTGPKRLRATPGFSVIYVLYILYVCVIRTHRRTLDGQVAKLICHSNRGGQGRGAIV